MEHQAWKDCLRSLRKKAGFDFAGMASAVRGRSTLLVWKEASGNRSKNYLKIVLEPGKGVAGGVYGREKAMIVQDTLQTYSESEIVNSPILLAEDLRSFAAFPLRAEGRIEGVLLLAMRQAGGITRERYAQLLDLLAGGICGMEAEASAYEDAIETVHPEYQALPIYELVDVPVREAINEERQRIARDLHDSVIQNLVGVQMQLRTLKYARDMEEVREGLKVADTSLNQIQEELREILLRVKPGVVEDLGLGEALRQHFRFLEASHGIHVDFTENTDGRRFGQDVETVVYRICQEACANACKYAQTGEIEVNLHWNRAGTLRLEVRDSGKGFDAENVKSKGGGMGLPGMQYWASSIGAELTVRSAPGRGTCVMLVVQDT